MVHKKNILMRWVKFTGQKLNTGELLWTNHGLAFVGTSYTTGEPSKILFIPSAEDWTFENGGINQRDKKGESDEFVAPDGKWYFKSVKGRWKREGQIHFVCTVTMPLVDTA